ncbi:hypothetical protein BAC1_02409 [uncultured bacterium]|nr:hypothetical protein BAC1_02409 [uncultured bacterium]
MNKKTINRLTISRRDLEQCQKFLDEIKKTFYGSITYEALLISAIIAYARPFSNNEHNKKPSADSSIDNSVLEKLTSKEIELHNKLIILRNKAIAHSESTYDSKTEQVYHPAAVSGAGFIVSRPFPLWNYFTPSNAEIIDFLNLVQKILKYAEDLTCNQLRVQ